MLPAPVVFWTHPSRPRGLFLLGLGSHARVMVERLLRRIPGGAVHVPNLPANLGRINTPGRALTVVVRRHAVGLVRPLGPADDDEIGAPVLLAQRDRHEYVRATLFPDERAAAAYARERDDAARRTSSWYAFEGSHAARDGIDLARLDPNGHGLARTPLEDAIDELLRRRPRGAPSNDDWLPEYLRTEEPRVVRAASR